MNGVLIVFWYWWLFGVVLLILEMLLPGAFFLWMAVSAAIVGFAVMLVSDLSLNYQLLLFSVLSILSIVGYHVYRRKNPSVTDQPNLNQRGMQYDGRIFTLQQPIKNGIGQLTVDDTIWRVEGLDMAIGETVKVIGSRGNSLLVIKS